MTADVCLIVRFLCWVVQGQPDQVLVPVGSRSKTSTTDPSNWQNHQLVSDVKLAKV